MPTINKDKKLKLKKTLVDLITKNKHFFGMKNKKLNSSKKQLVKRMLEVMVQRNTQLLNSIGVQTNE